jgi:hypothetical protein
MAMRIKQVEYCELKSIYGYGNIKIGFMAEIGRHEDFKAIMLDLKDKVRAELKKSEKEIEEIKSELQKIRTRGSP